MFRHRWVIALAAIATAFVLVASDANARAGGGFSSGSRGMRTFSAPPATRTAPNTAAPIQRSMTQPGSASTVGQAGARPGLLGGGLFGGGLMGGLAAGFIGESVENAEARWSHPQREPRGRGGLRLDQRQRADQELRQFRFLSGFRLERDIESQFGHVHLPNRSRNISVVNPSVAPTAVGGPKLPQGEGGDDTGRGKRAAEQETVAADAGAHVVGSVRGDIKRDDPNRHDPENDQHGVNAVRVKSFDMLMFRRRQFRHRALHRPDEERLPPTDTQYCLRSAPRQDVKSARNNADSAIGPGGSSREKHLAPRSPVAPDDRFRKTKSLRPT